MSGLEKYRNPNGTYDGVAALVDVTGMPRPEVLAMVEKAKANHARLESCSRHDFVAAGPAERMSVCTKCGGEASRASVVWYQAGMRHANAAR